MRRSSHLNLVNSSPSPQAVGEPVERPVPVDPYGPAPGGWPEPIKAPKPAHLFTYHTMTNALLFAFEVKSQRFEEVRKAFSGSFCTDVSLERAAQAAEQMGHDAAAFAEALRALRAERPE